MYKLRISSQFLKISILSSRFINSISSSKLFATIKGDGTTGVWSYQDDIETGSDETTITITTKDVDEDGNIDEDSDTKETNYTVTIDGDFSDVDDYSITIKDVDIVVDDESSKDAAITIEEDSKVDNITVEDADITVEKEGGAGIQIEDGTAGNVTEVDMTIEDVDITLNANGTAGIQVGDDNVESEDEGNVDVTLSFNGDNTISVEEGLLDSLANSETSVNVEGIVVGGNASDYAGPSGADLNDDSKVTITTGAEDSSLEISGVTTGIHVKDGTTLTIDGNGKDDDIEDPLDITIKDVENVNSTVAGNGIISYGTTVITDDVNVLIDGISTNEKYTGQKGLENANGIGSKRSGSLTISDGANVTINNITGTSTNAGIYLDGDSGELVIDDATVTITNVTSGIVAESPSGNGNPDITISNGAQVTIGKEEGDDILQSGIWMTGSTNDKVQKLTITGDGTNVLINNSQGKSSTSGIDIGNRASSQNSVLVISDGAVVQIGWEELTDAIQGCGMALINTDVFINTSAEVNIFNVLKYGIVTYGSNETEITVDYAKVTSVGSGATDMQVSDGDAANTTVTLKNNAEMTTDQIGLGGNDVTMIVDNSTFVANEGIDFGAGTVVLDIRNGSKVVAGAVYDWNAGDTNLIVSGGTLELIDIDEDNYRSTGLTKEYSEMLPSIAFATAESNGDVNFILPTSGALNGNEDLTNFRLNADELLAFQEANKGEMTDEQFLEAYGYVITTGDGTLTAKDEDNTPLGENQLVFQTYGADESGNYIDYNDNGATNMTHTEWYVVDLTKYTEEELEDLWVWTPSVVLSYFSLVDDNTLSDAEDSDESDPENVEVGSSLTNYHDVVVRGQSIAFGNFQTNSDYTTTDELEGTAYAVAKAAADEKGIVLYIYDAMDDGKATDSLSENDVIIIKGDDNKFYLASSGEEVGTYYYALVDDEGKFILDDDGNFIWYDEDGVAYTAESNGVALIAVLDSGTSYVLYVDGEYYRVNSNGEYTTVVAGEAIPVGSLWSVFDEYTRVRSNAQASGATYNFENVFGGVGATVTEIEPEEPEEDEETTPTDPDDPEPIIPIVPVVPVTPDTPAQPETPTETPEETPTETPADPEAPAETPETPASSTPKTGDDSNVAIYLVMAALSGAALIGLGVTGRKKNEEV